MKHQRTRLSLAIAACLLPAPWALANPQGPEVVDGQASFQNQGATLSVTNSNGAIINWQQFSVAPGETTRFNQPSADSAVLNRVQGPDPSQLAGTLSSNGKVFLVNPAGVVVGQGAKINVGGFVASTLNLSNANFRAGKLEFEATPGAGKVENQGEITTPTGGRVYLVGAQVSNEGLIQAPQGKVVLAAGDTVRLQDSSTPGVTVEITGSNNQATNLGQIVAQSGEVGVVGALVRNAGVINANQAVKDQSGRIFFKATKTLSIEKGSRISADADPALQEGAKAGSVSLESTHGDVSVEAGASVTANGPTGGTVTVSAPEGKATLAGEIEAQGSVGAGGAITATAQTVQVEATARLDVSGKTEGGQITLNATTGPAIVQPGAKLLAKGAKGGKITIAAKLDKVEQAGRLDVRGSEAKGGEASLQAATVIQQTGEVKADGQTQGGQIVLSADRIEQSGSLSSDGQTDGGLVALKATSSIRQADTGLLYAQGMTGQGGTVVVASQTSSQRPAPSDPSAPQPDPSAALLAGNIRVSGRRGGRIQLSGDRVGLFDNAHLDASGEQGGGEILVGGDYQGGNAEVPNAQASYVAPSAKITADAVESGNGGRVIVWSNESTRVYGQISAKGGAQGGDGGFVETSGHWLDVAGAEINASASHGNSGNWLLDPYSVTISTSATGGGAFDGSNLWTPSGVGSNILNTDINSKLNTGTSVTVATAPGGVDLGNIAVFGAISKTGGGDAGLTLIAHNNISFGAAITSTVGKLNLTLTPDSDASGSGSVSFTNTIDLRTGSLTLNGTSLLAGGTIKNATITTAGAATLATSAGNSTLDGVTLASDLTVTNSNYVNITSGLTLTGGRVLLNSTGQLTWLNPTNTLTIGGTGEIVFGGSSATANAISQNTGTLTLGSGVWVHGSQGGTVGNSGFGLVNQGRIIADTAGKTITVTGTGWSNTSGIIEAKNTGTINLAGSNWSNVGTLYIDASGGTFNLGGTFTTAGLGLVLGSAGTVNLTGILDNTSSTFTVNDTTGSLNLAGGTIKGGTVATAGAATISTSAGNSTLDGVTLASDLTINNSHYVNVTNGLTLAGGRVLLNSTGQFTWLNPTNTLTIGGTGEIVFGGTSATGNWIFQTVGTLTLGPGVWVHGSQGGTVGNSAYGLVNNGIISADTAGKTITVTGTGWSNSGTIEAKNTGTINLGGNWSNTGTLSIDPSGGTFNLGGSFTLADISGRIVRSNGTNSSITVTGILDLQNSSLPLDIGGGGQFGAGGLSSLNGSSARMINGTVVSGDGMAFTLVGAPDMEGLTLGNTAHPNLSVNGSAEIFNGLSFTSGGQFNKDNGTWWINGTGTQTLGVSGGGIATLSSAGGFIESYNSVAGAETVQLGAGLTLQGYVGLTDGWAGQSWVNLGTIDASAAGQNLTINPASFTNASGGTLRASVGTLNLNTPSFTNNGNTFVSGGTLNLGTSTTAWTNPGTISLSGGTLNLGGNFTTAPFVGTHYTRSGGTVNITGILDLQGSATPLDIGGTGQFGVGGLGSLNSSSARIKNGTVVSGDGTVFGFSGNPDLESITLGDAAHPSLSLVGNVDIYNGLTLAAGAQINRDNSTWWLNGSGTQTLGVAGGGTARLASAGGFIESFNSVAGAETVQLGAGLTLQGYVGLTDGWAGQSWVNLGTIDASVAGQSLSINPASFTNASGGTLRASVGTLNLNTPSFTNNGTTTVEGGTFNLGTSTTAWTNPGVINVSAGSLNLGGAFTTAPLVGTHYTRSGGTVNITGILDLQGSATPLDIGGTGQFGVGGLGSLNGGSARIKNGTVVSGDGTVFGFSGNPDLESLMLGDAAHPSLSLVGNVDIFNGLSLAAGAQINRDNSTWWLNGSGTQTLGVAGGGNATLASAGGFIESYNSVAGAETVQLSAGLTLQGYVRLGDAWAGQSWVNLGTIDASVAGQTLSINAGSFINNGLLRASAGSLSLSNFPNNAGVIELANSATVNINNANLTNAAGGVIRGTGKLDFGSTAYTLTNNGTLSPGASPGYLGIAGNLALASGSTTNIELGGLFKGSGYDVIQASGTIAINPGATMNVSYTGGFTAATSDVFQVLEAAGGLSGNFSTLNLPAASFNALYDAGKNLVLRNITSSPVLIWQVDTSGNWANAANWNLGRIPQTGDIVLIDRPFGAYTITLSSGTHSMDRLLSSENLTLSGGNLNLNGTAGSIINSTGTFTLSSGSLGGAGLLTLNGPGLWSGGTFAGNLAVASGQTLGLNGNFKSFGAGTLSNHGTLIWSGGNIDQTGSGTINNNGLFDIQGDLTWGSSTISTSSTLTFVNAASGEVRRSAGANTALLGNAGTFSDPFVFNNAGLLNVQTGTLMFNGGGANASASGTGVYTINTAATLEFQGGTTTLGTGSSLGGLGALSVNGGSFNVQGSMPHSGAILAKAGTLNLSPTNTLAPSSLTISGGTANINVSAATPSFTLSAGTLGGSGLITLNGPGLWSGGAMAGNLEIGNRQTLTVSGGSRSFTGLLGGMGTIDIGSNTLTNLGTLSPGPLAGTGAGTLTIQGNYAQGSGGKLNLDLGGATQGSYDVLAVSGNVAMAGTVNASLLSGYVPASGDAIAFLTTGGVATGTFASVNVPANFNLGYNLFAGEAARLDYLVGSSVRFFNNSAGDFMWGTALNWTGGQLPSSLDDAHIDAGFAVAHPTGNDTIHTLNINSGNALNVSGGSLAVASTSRLDGALTVSGAGAVQLGGAFSGAGTVNVGTGASLTLDGGTAGFPGSFNNGGTVNINAGTVSLGGGGLDTGAYHLATGSVLAFQGGTRTLGSGFLLDGSGLWQLNGANVTLNSALDVPAALSLELTGGSLDGSGNLTLNGGFLWSAGTASGSGVLETKGTTSVAGQAILQDKTWRNPGVVNLASNGVVYLNDTSVTGVATLENPVGGVINSNSQADYPFYGDGLAQFSNAGTLNWNATTSSPSATSNTLYTTGAFDNSGRVSVNENLTIHANGVDTGPYTIPAGKSLTMLSYSTSESRTWDLNPIYTSPAFVGTGTLVIDGNVVANKPLAFGTANTPTLAMLNGLLDAGFDLAVSGTFHWTAGTIKGSGLLTTTGLTTLSGASLLALKDKTWNNTGTIQQTDTVSLWLDDTDIATLPAPTLNNLAGGVYTMESTGGNPLYYSHGAFNNAGTLNWNKPGTIFFYPDGVFNNTGSVNANDNLNVQANGLDIGSYAVAAGKSLSFDDTTRSWNSGLAFTGSGSVVINGSAVTLNAPLTLNTNPLTLTGTGGTLTAASDLTVNSAFNWTSSNLAGAGHYTFAGGFNYQAAGGGVINATGRVDIQQSGDLSLPEMPAINRLFAQASGNVTLNGAITASDSGDAIVLATGGRFINNSGPSAVNAPLGRWLVWSNDPANDSLGGLNFGFKQYNAVFGSSTLLGSGNGLLYSLAPVFTPTLVGSISKPYDGNTSATLTSANYNHTGIAGDLLLFNEPAAGIYSSKNAGTNLNVTASGITLTGAKNGAANVYGYTLGSSTASGAVGTITPTSLTPNLAGTFSKIYDGGVTAILGTGSLSLTGTLPGDVLSVAATAAAYADKNAGTAKTVTASGLTLAGADAANYSLSATSASAAIGTITPTSLTPALSGIISKEYDGGTTATLGNGNTSLSGIIGNDTVTIKTPATGNYDSASIGTGKTVSFTGLTLNGTDAGNYQLSTNTLFSNQGQIDFGNMVWNGNGQDGLWNNPANWSGLQLPDANYNVVINTGGTVVTLSNGEQRVHNLSGGSLLISEGNLILDGIGQLSSLQFSGGSLTVLGRMAISGNFDWSGGSLGNQGGVTVAGTTTLSNRVDLNNTLNAGNIVNSGFLNINASAILHSTGDWINTGTVGGLGQILLGDGNNTLTNRGRIAPGASPGLLTINGNYVQAANSELNMELNNLSNTGYDQINISGYAQLAGALNLTGGNLNGIYPIIYAAGGVRNTFDRVNFDQANFITLYAGYGVTILKTAAAIVDRTADYISYSESISQALVTAMNISYTSNSTAGEDTNSNGERTLRVIYGDAWRREGDTVGQIGPTRTDPEGSVGGNPGEFGGIANGGDSSSNSRPQSCR